MIPEAELSEVESMITEVELNEVESMIPEVELNDFVIQDEVISSEITR